MQWILSGLAALQRQLLNALGLCPHCLAVLRTRPATPYQERRNDLHIEHRADVWFCPHGHHSDLRNKREVVVGRSHHAETCDERAA